MSCRRAVGSEPFVYIVRKGVAACGCPRRFRVCGDHQGLRAAPEREKWLRLPPARRERRDAPVSSSAGDGPASEDRSGPTRFC